MFELFHAIADAESAKLRSYIADREKLLAQVRFRNVTYAEVKADLLARGGTTAPALWDGATLLTDPAAILKRLQALEA